MSDYEQAVFISYPWGSEREEIVHEIGEVLQRRGISDKYLYSPNYMFELAIPAAQNEAESKPAESTKHAPNVSAANHSIASGGISISGIATSPTTNKGVRI